MYWNKCNILADDNFVVRCYFQSDIFEPKDDFLNCEIVTEKVNIMFVSVDQKILWLCRVLKRLAKSKRFLCSIQMSSHWRYHYRCSLYEYVARLGLSSISRGRTWKFIWQQDGTSPFGNLFVRSGWTLILWLSLNLFQAFVISVHAISFWCFIKNCARFHDFLIYLPPTPHTPTCGKNKCFWFCMCRITIYTNR